MHKSNYYDLGIYLAGLSGAGKSTVRQMFQDVGADTIYTKDLNSLVGVDERLPEFRAGETFASETEFLDRVLKIAGRRTQRAQILVCDSLRCPSELSFIKQLPQTNLLVYVACSEAERFRRVCRRGASHVIKQTERALCDRGGDPTSRFNIPFFQSAADFEISTDDSLVDTELKVRELYFSFLRASLTRPGSQIRQKGAEHE